MKFRNKYKTGFITPHGQYSYLRMSQRLIDISHIYSYFGDMVFGRLFKTIVLPTKLSFIENQDD